VNGAENPNKHLQHLPHKKFDAAVFAAYSWPDDLSDGEIFARLLSLNLERTAQSG
jgi:hypothetical protein